MNHCELVNSDPFEAGVTVPQLKARSSQQNERCQREASSHGLEFRFDPGKKLVAMGPPTWRYLQIPLGIAETFVRIALGKQRSLST